VNAVQCSLQHSPLHSPSLYLDLTAFLPMPLFSLPLLLRQHNCLGPCCRAPLPRLVIIYPAPIRPQRVQRQRTLQTAKHRFRRQAFEEAPYCGQIGGEEREEREVQFEENEGDDAGDDEIAVLDVVAVVDGFDDEGHAGCEGGHGAVGVLVKGNGREMG
jgi:hypothetical protein